MKTTLHTVLCIVIRVGAVLLFISMVELLPNILMSWSQTGGSAISALYLTGAVALLAFGLWLWPNILAWWATNRSHNEILESPISADQLHRIAFSIVGVWLFISGVGSLLARAVMMLIIFRSTAYGDSVQVLRPADWYWLVAHGVTTAAGAWLALSSRGLVGLLRRVRDYPHAAIINADPDTTTTQDG